MSIVASILRSVYKISGAKKAFALPEDALRKEIEKQNRHRGVFTPTDRKAYYETIAVNGFPCLIVREHPKPSERAILYFFGGGMVIGPDKGDLPVMRKLCRETGCDVWFPFYPLCMEHCITETYAMVYECYRKMITLYGGGNVSTCGFSSGGALALGIAAHNNAQPEPLPQPRHIVVVSPLAAFPPAVRWLWGSRRTTTRSPSRCRSRDTSSLYPPVKCRGTMRKRRGCRRSINGTFPSTMPLW